MGFHGHENLGLSVANSLMAVRAGAVQIDGSTRAFGAGAGNTPLEVFAAVADRQGIVTGLDVLGLVDVAEDIVRPIMDGECVKDRLAIIMGYAGVYSSYLKHAYRAAERYGVSGAETSWSAGARAWSAARRTRSSRSPPIEGEGRSVSASSPCRRVRRHPRGRRRRASGHLAPHTEEKFPDLTLEQGYEIQALLAGRRPSAGRVTGGGQARSHVSGQAGADEVHRARVRAAVLRQLPPRQRAVRGGVAHPSPGRTGDRVRDEAPPRRAGACRRPT
ncbi:MAG: hypothetical protein R2713_23000 [Ilumatobacteraceae bacterium]